jgi:hypothetical protein
MNRSRGVLAIAGVVVASLLLAMSLVGVWAKRNFLDTDRFTSRAAPLAEDPAVQTLVADRLTDEIMTLVNPAELFQEALPDRGQILAVPLANAVGEFVHDRVLTFTQSDRFAQLWEGAVRTAHGLAIRVLRDEGTAIRTTDGTVTIDLVPAIEAILATISAQSPELFGREIDIPDLSVDELPDAAKTRIEQALGVDLDDPDFGQITVYQNDSLAVAQDAVNIFDRAVVLLVLATLVVIGLTLLASRHRRITLMQLAAGFFISMVFLRRIGFQIDDEVAKFAKTTAGENAIRDVVDRFLDPLLTFASYVMIASIVLFLVGLATSDNIRIAERRTWVIDHTKALAQSIGGKASDDSVVTWIGAHRNAVLWGGIGLAVVLVWTVDLSWVGLLLLVAAVVALVVIVQRTAPPAPPTAGTPVAAGGGSTP